MQILSLLSFLTLNEWMVLLIFLSFIYLLFRGYPVAFALVGVSLGFTVLAAIVLDPFAATINEQIAYSETRLSYKRLFANVGRFFGGLIKNPVLVALPMFIFMGFMLDQSGIAQQMMKSMQRLFGALRGGLALSVLLIGIVLAASTGVIGASVVLLGVMGLPAMMGQGYSKPIASGTAAASGTLGILIPPSIMLVIMSDQLAISLGDLFMGALFPGLILGGLYITFIIAYGLVNPAAMPLPERRETVTFQAVFDVLKSVFPPFALVILVLGSIFFGIATPTEASGLGALGATILVLVNRGLDLKILRNVMRQTLNTSGFIFAIFAGANLFAYVMRLYGGDDIIRHMIEGSFENPYHIVLFILLIIFLLGFLLDWIEITLIVIPLILPIIQVLDIPVEGYGIIGDPIVVWFAVLTALTLQTSFLTPPVGFALFYLKGVCPPGVTIGHIYRGIIPFVALQLLGLIIVFAFPKIVTWLPAMAYGN